MRLRKFVLCILAAVLVTGGKDACIAAAEATDGILTTLTAEQEITVMQAQQTVEETEEKEQSGEENNQEIEEAGGYKEAETVDGAEDMEAAEAGKETKEVTGSEKADRTEAEQEEEETKAAKKEKTSKSSKKTAAKSVEQKAAKQKAYTKAELRLLASLIYCESNGEPYAGKLAVGIVVVNRMESKAFPDTLKDVIFQKYQFGPARNGTLRRVLKEYDEGRFTGTYAEECIKAAKEALSGVKKVTYRGKTTNMKDYLYFSGRVANARMSIANHQFK